jgi:hypothetical protein
MAKVTGATLHFYWNNVEYPVEAVSFDGAWEELDATDSSTLTPATDFIVNRAKRSSKVDALLDAAHGATLATGQLEALKKYIVVLGQIDESPNSYPVGTIFTSDGSGNATASNQVAPLGAKLIGKNIVCNVNNNNAGVLGFKFNEAYGEYDATDSTTTGDSTEFITGRVKRTGSIEMIMSSTAADMVVSSPTAQAVILTFGAGLTLTGNAVFTKKAIVSTAKGDMVKVTYDMTWVGPVISTLPNLIDAAVQHACKVVWKSGNNTNKQVSGNGLVMSRAIETDVHGLGKISYGLNWVGLPTEAVES